MSNLVIPFSESANTYCDRTLSSGTLTATYAVVGTLAAEVINVEVPCVELADKANDTHWTPLYQNGNVVALKADNNAVTIPVNLPIRLKKVASVGNAFGVSKS